MDELPEQADAALHPEQALSQKQASDRINTLVDALPDRQKAALSLCAFEGLGNIEAAEAMGVSIEALESLLARARRKLRLELAGESGA